MKISHLVFGCYLLAGLSYLNFAHALTDAEMQSQKVIEEVMSGILDAVESALHLDDHLIIESPCPIETVANIELTDIGGKNFILDESSFYGSNWDQFVKLLNTSHVRFDKPIEMGNARFRLSEPFSVSQGRLGVLMIVEIGGVQYLRAAYSSRSQGKFRILPAINLETSPAAPYYDKGEGEETLNLPEALQKEILLKLDRQRILPEEVGEGLLHSVVHINEDLSQTDSYHRSFSTHPSTHIVKVNLMESLPNPNPDPDSDMPMAPPTLGPKPPQQVRFPNENYAPNFQDLLEKYETTLPLSGKVTAYRYPSRDQNIQYTVYEEQRTHRIWFGGAEFQYDSPGDDVPFNSLGLRMKTPVLGNELGLPLWEYHKQIPRGYASAKPHNAQPSYSHTWEYLRRIPFIREWYAENGVHLPE